MLTDITTMPMSLYGALSAVGLLLIFLGSWWYYGMRPQAGTHQH